MLKGSSPLIEVVIGRILSGLVEELDHALSVELPQCNSESKGALMKARTCRSRTFAD